MAENITIKKNNQVLYCFCKTCGKQSKPVRKIENDLYYQLWIISCIASLGILVPVFLIFHFVYKKKIFCGTCSNKIKFYDSPDKFPGSKAQIHRIVTEIKSNKEEIEYVSCEFCHEKIEKNSVFCKICGAKLTIPE